MRKLILATFLLSGALWAETPPTCSPSSPCPTQANFVPQLLSAISAVNNTLSGLPTAAPPAYCAHLLAVQQGFDVTSLANMIGQVDTLANAGVNCVMANVEIGYFLITAGTGGTPVSNVSTTLAYARSNYGMKIILRPTTTSTFVADACGNVASGAAWCTASAFTNFANYQTAWLQALDDGPVVGGHVGALQTYNPDAIYVEHEPSGVVNAALGFTLASQGTPANHKALMAAAATAFRGLTGCSRCTSTMEIGIDLLGGGSTLDTTRVLPIVVSATGLSSIGIDLYNNNGNCSSNCQQDVRYTPTNIISDVAMIVAAAKSNGLAWHLGESNEPYWIPYSTTSGPGAPSQSASYRGNGDSDWPLLHGISNAWHSMVYRLCAAYGCSAFTKFNTLVMMYAAQYRNQGCTSCGSDGSNPNSQCGVNGTACTGDLGTNTPYTTNAFAEAGFCTPYCQYWSFIPPTSPTTSIIFGGWNAN
ncbi:MAG: hypothetical protein U0Q18_25270 [Bryobacteraceae bacterium]